MDSVRRGFFHTKMFDKETEDLTDNERASPSRAEAYSRHYPGLVSQRTEN